MLATFGSNTLIKKGLLFSSIAIFGLLLSLMLAQYGFSLWSNQYLAVNPIAFINEYFYLTGNQRWQWTICLSLSLFIYFKVLFDIGKRIFKKKTSLYGDAHFANRTEAKQAGLFVNEGIIIGHKWRRYLKVDGHEHIIVFSPSGSGKSASIAIPNLLSLDDSMIVNDTKFELFKLTSKFRQEHGHQCFCWAPSNESLATHCFNPLDFVPRDKFTRIKYLQKIARLLIPDNHHSDPIWTCAPRDLFVAVALYLFDRARSNITIGRIARIIKDEKFEGWFKKIYEKKVDCDPVFYRNLSGFFEMDIRTRSNIIKSFCSYFSLWDDPIIDAATSKSDFDIRFLRKEKITIYIGFSLDDMSRLSPLLTVFWQQVLDFLTKEEPCEDEKQTVVLLMDEFSVLGRMESFVSAVGLLRSYHVRLMVIMQNLSQIVARYGEHDAKSFINSKVKVVFTQSDIDDATYISQFLGNNTVNANKKKLKENQLTGNEHLVARPLMLPQELREMNQKNVLLMIKGSSPVMAKQVSWYKDKAFQLRNLGNIGLPKIDVIIHPYIYKVEKNKTITDEEKLEKRRQHELDKIKVQAEVLAGAIVQSMRRMERERD